MHVVQGPGLWEGCAPPTAAVPPPLTMSMRTFWSCLSVKPPGSTVTT